MIASASVAASALISVTSPGQAAQEKVGVGHGRAVIHVDVASATVTRTGKHAYRMTIPLDSPGQWMGERTNAQGTSRTVVGDLSAKKLSNRWSRFRYGSARASGTLAWFTAGIPSAARVRLGRPTITSQGVRFDFTSRAKIPSRISDVSMNLLKAPDRKARASDWDINIADDLYIEAGYYNSSYVYTRIYNSSNDNTCWTGSGAKNIQQGDPNPVSVTTNTCDNILYENAIPASGGNPAYGVWVVWVKGTTPGNMTYYLTITPPAPNPSFAFTQQVMVFP